MIHKDELPDDVTLREHEYDGIQEYDQKLPNWWLFTFYIAIAWFVVAWVAYYQLPFRTSSDEEQLAGRLALIEIRKNQELEGMLAKLTDESLLEMSGDPTHIAAGKAIFETKCVACHGIDLSATLNGMQLPGVPLNDTEWKYGGKPLDIMNTVTNGSPRRDQGNGALERTALSLPDRPSRSLRPQQPTRLEPCAKPDPIQTTHHAHLPKTKPRSPHLD